MRSSKQRHIEEISINVGDQLRVARETRDGAIFRNGRYQQLAKLLGGTGYDNYKRRLATIVYV